LSVDEALEEADAYLKTSYPDALVKYLCIFTSDGPTILILHDESIGRFS
jgi:hypothetical protein